MSQELSPQEQKAKVWAELDAQASGATTSHQPQEQQRQEDEAALQQVAAQEAAPTQAAAAEDPYAGLPDFVRNEITGLKTMVGQAMTRLRSAEGHIGGLNSQLKQAVLARAQQGTEDTGGRVPTAGEIKAAQGDTAAMQKLIDEYPEFGNAMKGALEQEIAQVREELKRIASASKPVADAEVVKTQDLEAFKRRMLVESRHPGWEAEVATPEFAGWLQSQAREVQMLAGSNDPQDAVRLLDLRRQGAGRTQQERQRTNSAASIPSGRPSSGLRPKPVEEMTKAEYWAHLDQLEQQGR